MVSRLRWRERRLLGRSYSRFRRRSSSEKCQIGRRCIRAAWRRVMPHWTGCAAVVSCCRPGRVSGQRRRCRHNNDPDWRETRSGGLVAPRLLHPSRCPPPFSAGRRVTDGRVRRPAAGLGHWDSSCSCRPQKLKIGRSAREAEGLKPHHQIGYACKWSAQRPPSGG